MKRTITVSITTLILLLVSISICFTANAHGGNTNADGGHYDHNKGEYHYHHGYSAHQHPNNVCPYNFDDATEHKAYITKDKENDSVTTHSVKEKSSEEATTIEEEKTYTAKDYIKFIVQDIFLCFFLYLFLFPFIIYLLISISQAIIGKERLNKWLNNKKLGKFFYILFTIIFLTVVTILYYRHFFEI